MSKYKSFVGVYVDCAESGWYEDSRIKMFIPYKGIAIYYAKYTGNMLYYAASTSGYERGQKTKEEMKYILQQENFKNKSKLGKVMYG